MFLYARSPNEHNKKIFLFPKYNSLWMWGTTFYFALIGGQMLKRFDLLFSYYVGFFLFGIVTYFILSRLTNYKVLKERSYVSKALWVHTYKQSKYIIWLFWLVSFMYYHINTI